MSIDFLKVTPEEAVNSLRDMIEKGYHLYNTIRSEYSKTSDEERRKKISDWQTEINKWYLECKKELTSVYMSHIYIDEFFDIEILSADFGELEDFTNMRRHMRQRLMILRKNYDFIIQHSNAKFNVNGNMIFQLGTGNNAEIN